MGKKVGKPKGWYLAPSGRSMGCLGSGSEIRIKRMRKGQIDGRQNKTTKVGGETIKREPGLALRSEWRLVVRTKCVSRVNLYLRCAVRESRLAPRGHLG